LPFVGATPEQYQKRAEEYYETSINIELINYVFSHQALTETIVHNINPHASIRTLNEDLQEIGYISI
jgi:hypothetical protein